MNFTITHTYAARSLADHKSDFAYAESLARDGEKLAAWYMSIMPASIYSSVGERADALDAMKASQRDALAWVYYNQGRYDDAQRELDIALDLTKKDPTIYYHLGKLRQAQGRAEDAELAFTQGMTLRYRGVNPNRKELETAYRQHHGSMDGWPDYVAQLEAKERATRKARILAAKPSDVSLGQGFKLVSLSGDSVSSASLKGHYTVVNFWGTWCGPCVAEMPELQQFYDKYRKDSSVVVLTISNDKDLQELKDWMAKRKYTIPTLYDDGYVSAAGIEAWPTTWFIDPDGKVRYTAVGNGGALVEEWSWRLEAMRPAPVTP
jgi:thiol-disulfide isomerase/thioredoxin